jgi:hypothetical protein
LDSCRIHATRRHYEGRGWRGFHHHATLCVAAHPFLIAERAKIPPQSPAVPPINARRLAFPKIVNPEAPPVRPERHVANSIATMRRHLIVALVTTLALCPCCNASRKTTTPLQFYDAVRLGFA